MLVLRSSKRKFFLTTFVCALFFITGLFSGFHSTVEAGEPTPWLQVEGIHIKDPNGNKVVLRGVSLPDIALNDYRNGSGKSATELIEMLTDQEQGWYSTVIRLPVYPIWKLGYNSNPSRYEQRYLRPAVEKCVEKNIYCIIDWHYVDDPRQLDRETRAFWSDIAYKYKDYPNIMFEVFNENKTDMSWAEWKSIVQPWVDLIQDYAPKNLVLVGAPHYSQHLFDAPDNPINGENIVYVAHVYPGLDQRHWDNWMFNAADKIPIFVTEWGFRKDSGKVTSGTISSYGKAIKNKLEQYNLSWTSWVADYEWEPEMFDSDWNLLVGENEMGGFVKDYLTEKRDQKIVAMPIDTVGVERHHPLINWLIKIFSWG